MANLVASEVTTIHQTPIGKEGHNLSIMEIYLDHTLVDQDDLTDAVLGVQDIIALLSFVRVASGGTVTAWEMSAANGPYLYNIDRVILGDQVAGAGDVTSSTSASGIKFGSGLILLGAGFFVMLWASQYIDGGQVGPQWLIACYFFHTVGELVLSPVGLSAVTKLSPDRLVSQMMGTWFMGAALGNLIAGIVAGGLEESHPSVIFRTVALVAVGAGILFLVLSPWMKKLAGGIR